MRSHAPLRGSGVDDFNDKSYLADVITSGSTAKYFNYNNQFFNLPLFKTTSLKNSGKADFRRNSQIQRPFDPNRKP
jgi:hypothetical protein